MKLLESTFPTDVKLKKLLVLGDRFCTLPTEILLKKEWGCQEIRRVLNDPSSYETDNFVNFIHLLGWKFKSGRIRTLCIQNSSIDLILVNDKGESVDSRFDFDSILVQDIGLFENLSENTFKKGTQLFFFVESLQLPKLAETFERLSLNKSKIEWVNDQNFNFAHLEI